MSIELCVHCLSNYAYYLHLTMYTIYTSNYVYYLYILLCVLFMHLTMRNYVYLTHVYYVLRGNHVVAPKHLIKTTLYVEHVLTGWEHVLFRGDHFVM